MKKTVLIGMISTAVLFSGDNKTTSSIAVCKNEDGSFKIFNSVSKDSEVY